MEPGVGGPLDGTSRPESSRNPSLLLANIRVLFVHHRRIRTARSSTSARPPWEQSDAGHPTDGQADPKPKNGPTPQGFGQRLCRCSHWAAPHCLLQVAHGFGFRPAKHGHPRTLCCPRAIFETWLDMPHIFYSSTKSCEAMNGNWDWQPDRPDQDWRLRNKANAIEL